MRCVIWDLDETLWEGTIASGNGVILKPETKEVLKQLDKLGIVQLICTHNIQARAENALHEHEIAKYFKGVFASVNLEKNEMIKQMLEKEKISPEECVFIDDSPINRALVYESLGVHVDYFQDLYEIMKYFDTNRLILMNQQRNRTIAEKRWTGDFKDFLKKIENKITIKEAEFSEIPRIIELANRTNEMNTTKTSYNEELLKNLLANDDCKIYVAYLSDIYGDYGLVGEIMCTTTSTDCFIRDICVSCRTMGRGVGKALIEQIKNLKADKQRITGLLIQNEYNSQMKGLFESCGFTPYKQCSSTGKTMIWYEYVN